MMNCLLSLFVEEYLVDKDYYDAREQAREILLVDFGGSGNNEEEEKPDDDSQDEEPKTTAPPPSKDRAKNNGRRGTPGANDRISPSLMPPVASIK